MNRETLLGVTLMIISTLVPGSRGISCVACGCSIFSKQLHCSGICPGEFYVYYIIEHFGLPIILMLTFLLPGPGSPVQTVHCPRGYCHSFTTHGSGDNVSITRNCYNKHEVARRHLISVVPWSMKHYYAGPGAVLEPAEGRHGRDARGEQVLHAHHPGRGLHRVSLRLQRLQQPGHQHPGGSEQQITSPDFNLALFRIQLSSCLCS